MNAAPGTRADLLEVPLTVDPAHARVTRIELAPGQAAGRHRHPGDVIGWIVSGAVHYAREDADEVLLRAGDAFHEPKDAVVTRFDNASDDEPAVFAAVYLLRAATSDVIEML